jgi:CheY-like chemotaxis protein
MISLAGKHVLLCEDHPLNQEIAKTLLSEKQVIVSIASDGKIGVDMFRESSPGFYDAVLMDIRMPVMNGYEATRAIRALRRSDAKTVPRSLR